VETRLACYFCTNAEGNDVCVQCSAVDPPAGVWYERRLKGEKKQDEEK